MDNISISRISLLHPKTRKEVSDHLVTLNNQNIGLRIIEGLRTNDVQNAYYYQDKLPLDQVNALRLKAKLPIFKDKSQLIWASNAKGGESYHCYGLAFDYCLLHKDETISFNMTEDMNSDHKSDWMTIVELFQSTGWTWGNKFHDNDHLEKSFGYTCQQLMNLPKDKEGYPIF